MLQNEHIAELILKSWANELSPEEAKELQDWMNADPENASMMTDFKDIDWVIQQMRDHENVPTQSLKRKTWEKWKLAKKEHRTRILRIGRIKIKKQHLPWLYAAAASIVAVIVWAIYNQFSGPVRNKQAQEITQLDSVKKVSPGTDKAILRLANGAEFDIMGMAKRNITQMQNLLFKQDNGAVICKRLPGNMAVQDLGYNTLETPRGGEYQLALPDGTKVWLKPESKIKFPSVDTGSKRIVILEGAAYFEVAKASKSTPFIIKANGGELEVTGTKFNVTAYPEENYVKASLAEGHLRVHSGGKTVSIEPLHSAIFSRDSQPKVMEEANLANILAWKENSFRWEKDSLTTALRELGRWYNVHIVYRNTPTTIIKYVNQFKTNGIDEIFNSLKADDNSIKFELKKDTLFVSQQRLH